MKSTRSLAARKGKKPNREAEADAWRRAEDHAQRATARLDEFLTERTWRWKS